MLAPRVCVGCAQEGSWLCVACMGGIERESNTTCVGCGSLSRFGATCDRCRAEFPIAGVVTIASYRDPAVQQLVQAVKYASAKDMVDAFARLIADFFDRTVMEVMRKTVGEQPLLVPVPLHWRRFAARGFNQSQCIAEALAGAGWGTVVPEGCLVRRKCKLPQAVLSHEQRFKNIEEAFTCVDPAMLRGRSVVIVDDVITTGATMAACARELRRVDVRTPWGFAIARG
ncbi:ComF family protein [Candidatus Uhrbacteria bacterium]|nr:ComF family protein [Candidatus Uhrbacteria bacterium]